MKYEFIKVDEDTTKLKYKNKEFLIKKDIDLLKKLGSIQQKAKTNMFLELTKKGITAKDLEVEKHEGNKTTIDKSNLIELEKYYLDLAAQEVLNEICEKYTEMGLLALLNDIGLDDKESEKFAYDLLFSLRGEASPRGEKEQNTI